MCRAVGGLDGFSTLYHWNLTKRTRNLGWIWLDAVKSVCFFVGSSCYAKNKMYVGSYMLVVNLCLNICFAICLTSKWPCFFSLPRAPVLRQRRGSPRRREFGDHRRRGRWARRRGRVSGAFLTCCVITPCEKIKGNDESGKDTVLSRTRD